MMLVTCMAKVYIRVTDLILNINGEALSMELLLPSQPVM